MNFSKIILLLIFLSSCSTNTTNKFVLNKKESKVSFSTSGFVLVYNEKIYKNKIVSKKMNIDNMVAMHPYLKKNTFLKLYNPSNSKSVLVKVYKNADFPNIYKLTINNEVANLLDIDFENPFIEILETKENKKFIAKKADMFDEEKVVADKAPVKSVKIDELSTNKNSKIDKKKNFSYNIVISDFYFLKTANELKNKLVSGGIKKLSIKKKNNNLFRLKSGPYMNFSDLKENYINLNILGFDNIDVYRN